MRLGADYDKTPDHNGACGCYVDSAAEPQKGSLCIFTLPHQLDVSTMYHQKSAFVQLTLCSLQSANTAPLLSATNSYPAQQILE